MLAQCIASLTWIIATLCNLFPASLLAPPSPCSQKSCQSNLVNTQAKVSHLRSVHFPAMGLRDIPDKGSHWEAWHGF